MLGQQSPSFFGVDISVATVALGTEGVSLHFPLLIFNYLVGRTCLMFDVMFYFEDAAWVSYLCGFGLLVSGAVYFDLASPNCSWGVCCWNLYRDLFAAPYYSVIFLTETSPTAYPWFLLALMVSFTSIDS